MNCRTLFFLILLTGCQTSVSYEVDRYLTKPEQTTYLTSILVHILDAPPYVKTLDRFSPLHRSYYSGQTHKYTLDKYYINENGTHFFYVLRPAPGGMVRGVGGHYRQGSNGNLISFREEFVTPALPLSEVKGRCAFLFEEMVNGTLEKYTNMPTFVQWPNAISVYDTTLYSWVLKPGYETVR